MFNRRSFCAGSTLLLASGCLGRPGQSSIVPSTKLAEIEQRIGGRLGVALVDSDGKLLTSFRGDERFAMCSTFKAPLASALFAAHDAGRVDMYAEFALKLEDRVPYMPFVDKRLAENIPVSLNDLARAAVMTSDNAAANLILKAIGGPAGFTKFVRDQGDEVTRLDRIEPHLNSNLVNDTRDTSSPAAMARLMQVLAIKDATTSPGKLMLQKWLKDSKTGGARIRAGLPEGWPVGDKTGTAPGSTAYNDVAIIWPSSGDKTIKPVILVVYTDRPKAVAKEVNAAIADVAKAIVPLIATHA